MTPSKLTRIAALASAAVLAVAMLAGCAPIVSLEPASDAVNPACAEVIVRLPKAIDTFEKRQTDAQATGAWGDPASILLRCGVEVPGPSPLLCVTLNGIDWLRDPSDAPNYVFTTYGRDPAIEVIVDGDVASGTNALMALALSVGTIPAERECTNPDDVLGVPEP
jgi:hypothetical protein